VFDEKACQAHCSGPVWKDAGGSLFRRYAPGPGDRSPAILAGVEVPPIGAGVVILFAVVYIVSVYLAGMLSAWIYNIVAARLGGVEYTVNDIALPAK
jgi:hypothetical protein